MALSDIPQAVRHEVYARDGRRCRWCGRTNAGLHIHHVAYRSAGGEHELANLICLCPDDHRLVHDQKFKYTPLLFELIERGPGVTGLQLCRWLAVAYLNDAEDAEETV